MVKVGFICEGETEKIIVNSVDFKNILGLNNLQLVNAIDATGSGNLLPKYITPFIESLKDDGAEKIFILTDLDEDACITKTKERINAPETVVVVISVKQIESWFLADSATLSKVFGKEYQFGLPENENYPIEKLREIFIAETGRGIGDSKPRFAKRFINEGFSILNAANHPNCNSARYLLNKLKK
jgi:predicted ATP-dependent endonuclease of OLD family